METESQWQTISIEPMTSPDYTFSIFKALASICINQVHFPHTLDILAQSYELKGMVRCASHHFTKAINNHTEWICIDD